MARRSTTTAVLLVLLRGGLLGASLREHPEVAATAGSRGADRQEEIGPRFPPLVDDLVGEPDLVDEELVVVGVDGSVGGVSPVLVRQTTAPSDVYLESSFVEKEESIQAVEEVRSLSYPTGRWRRYF